MITGKRLASGLLSLLLLIAFCQNCFSHVGTHPAPIIFSNPTDSTVVSSTFMDDRYWQYPELKYHNGIDINASVDKDITPSANGTVVYYYDLDESTKDNVIVMHHGRQSYGDSMYHAFIAYTHIDYLSISWFNGTPDEIKFGDTKVPGDYIGETDDDGKDLHISLYLMSDSLAYPFDNSYQVNPSSHGLDSTIRTDFTVGPKPGCYAGAGIPWCARAVSSVDEPWPGIDSVLFCGGITTKGGNIATPYLLGVAAIDTVWDDTTACFFHYFDHWEPDTAATIYGSEAGRRTSDTSAVKFHMPLYSCEWENSNNTIYRFYAIDIFDEYGFKCAFEPNAPVANVSNVVIDDEEMSWLTTYEEGTESFRVLGANSRNAEQWEIAADIVKAKGVGTKYSAKPIKDFNYYKLQEHERPAPPKMWIDLGKFSREEILRDHEIRNSVRAEFKPRAVHVFCRENQVRDVERYAQDRARYDLATRIEVVEGIGNDILKRGTALRRTGEVIPIIWPMKKRLDISKVGSSNIRTLVLGSEDLNENGELDAYAAELTSQTFGPTAVREFNPTTALPESLQTIIEEYNTTLQYVVIFGKPRGVDAVPFWGIEAPDPRWVRSGETHFPSFGYYEGQLNSIEREVGYIPVQMAEDVLVYLDKIIDHRYRWPFDAEYDINDFGLWVFDEDAAGNSGDYAEFVAYSSIESAHPLWNIKHLVSSEISTSTTEAANTALQENLSAVAMLSTASKRYYPAYWLHYNSQYLTVNLDSSLWYAHFLPLSCHSNEWNYSEWTHVMEEFLLLPMGGAISSIGPTAGAYQEFYGEYLAEYFKQYNNCRDVFIYGRPTIGWLHKTTRNVMMDRHPDDEYVQAFCNMMSILGDPTTTFWGPLANEVFDYMPSPDSSEVDITDDLIICPAGDHERDLVVQITVKNDFGQPLADIDPELITISIAEIADSLDPEILQGGAETLPDPISFCPDTDTAITYHAKSPTDVNGQVTFTASIDSIWGGGCGAIEIQVFVDDIPISSPMTARVRSSDMTGDNVHLTTDTYRFLPYYYAARGFCADFNPYNSTDSSFVVGFPDYFKWASHWGPGHSCTTALPKNAKSVNKQSDEQSGICESKKGSNAVSYLKVSQARDAKSVRYYNVDVYLDDLGSARAMQLDLNYDRSNTRFVDWEEGDIFQGDDAFAVVDRQEQSLVDIALMSYKNDVSRGNYQIGTARFESLDGKEPIVSIRSLYVADEDWVTCSVVPRNNKNEILTPTKYGLVGNTPNPFNPSTTISFELPEPAVVTMGVYDVTGRLIRQIISSAHYGAGRHSIVWDGKSDTDRDAGSGIYFCKMQTESFEEVQRMTLIR